MNTSTNSSILICVHDLCGCFSSPPSTPSKHDEFLNTCYISHIADCRRHNIGGSIPIFGWIFACKRILLLHDTLFSQYTHRKASSEAQVNCQLEELPRLLKIQSRGPDHNTNSQTSDSLPSNPDAYLDQNTNSQTPHLLPSERKSGQPDTGLLLHGYGPLVGQVSQEKSMDYTIEYTTAAKVAVYVRAFFEAIGLGLVVLLLVDIPVDIYRLCSPTSQARDVELWGRAAS